MPFHKFQLERYNYALSEARLDTPKLGMTIWLALAMDGRCHDPSHGGSYVVEGRLLIRIGLCPRRCPRGLAS